MPSLGPLELGIILVIVLLVFGPKRLPGLGKQIGTGMREFKDSITGKDKDDDVPAQSLPAAPAQPVEPQAPVPAQTPAEPAAPDGDRAARGRPVAPRCRSSGRSATRTA